MTDHSKTARAREAARRANARRRHERWAEEMREWGWTVEPPKAQAPA